jgi:uncharacterized membrane protein YdbT with pleckstrin-like domain
MIPTQNYIKKLHPHPIAFLGFYFFTLFFLVLGVYLFHILFLVGIFSIIVAILVFVAAEISRSAESFYILDGGIERGYKFLSSTREFIGYEKIQDLDVSQGIFQSLFSVGNIKFDTAGTNQIEISFYCVKDPYSIEKIVRDRMTEHVKINF